MTTEHAAELARGDRFAFGRNWSDYLNSFDDSIVDWQSQRSARASASIGSTNSFVDAGSGSGLFSLAARILGSRVHSFDNEFVFQRVR